MQALEIQQGGYQCECGKWINDPQAQFDHEAWHARKAEGEKVAALLLALPLGTEFTLANAGRAYSATYRKNSDGTWDQVYAVEQPLVRSMDAAHLGFCVGFEAVAGAVERTGR